MMKSRERLNDARSISSLAREEEVDHEARALALAINQSRLKRFDEESIRALILRAREEESRRVFVTMSPRDDHFVRRLDRRYRPAPSDPMKNHPSAARLRRPHSEGGRNCETNLVEIPSDTFRSSLGGMQLL